MIEVIRLVTREGNTPCREEIWYKRLAQTSKKSINRRNAGVVLYISHNRVNAYRTLQTLGFSGMKGGQITLIVKILIALYLGITK